MFERITRSPGAGSKTPLVFVHGAWCWDEFFLPYFADHGYECHAFSLRGHSRLPMQSSGG